ncbi:venom carboxylesterase-6-like [Pararge aegeria]|uniref:venom carboxylesterase-6-like n=1 Tax=Pararge aegeria TaxID=116150 RepID=UPI0019D2FCA9|nr:venom carboxylesterase-6-like [Pararge aegeria]
MTCLRLYVLLLLVAVVRSRECSDPIVKVANGEILGKQRISTNGRNFVSFLGVPYASPPIGKYRFKEPQPMQPWSGPWNATRLPPGCLQFDPSIDKITGSEDCLFVNVHTPNLHSSALLPVVIFIHGGAYVYGAGGQYDGVHMMDRDVVLVTVNYRLGPLGFLSTGDTVIPGNTGLKDQSFALKWVRDNIKSFGGNPDSVTLTGCSAGGASVHYHYLSPLSKGLFHRGIAFSGAAFTSWAHSIKPVQKAKELASLVGCDTTNSRDMAECLRSRPGEMIVNAQIEMFDYRVKWFNVFAPTAEDPNTKNPFLTQHPYTASQAGEMQRLPLIASVTSEEGLYPAAAYQKEPTILPELEARWEELASNIFEFNETLPISMRTSVANRIKEKYLDGRPVSQKTFDELVQALGDRLFTADVGKLAQIHATQSRQPTYSYRFSYSWQYSFSNVMARNYENYGVCHSDDVILVLKYLPTETTCAEDLQMREALLDMICSYAETGVPKLPNAPKWMKVKPGQEELSYMEIAGPSDIKMKSSADFGKKTFWDSLGFNEDDDFNGIYDEF